KPMIEVAEKQNDTGLVGGIICYANRPNVIWFAGGLSIMVANLIQ
ncbi:unnamed protein product, partial [marine sediment metagenome]